MRSCSLEEAALVGPGRRSESGVPGGGRRVCGRQRGGLCLGRVSIRPQRKCRLEQLGRPYCLSWEPARAEGWAVTWQHMVRLKMSRLCPGEHLTQGSQETCTRMFIAAASCVIVESWTQPSYPSSRDGVNSDELKQWESSPHHDRSLGAAESRYVRIRDRTAVVEFAAIYTESCCPPYCPLFCGCFWRCLCRFPGLWEAVCEGHWVRMIL